MPKKEIRTICAELRALEPNGEAAPLRFSGYAAEFNSYSFDLGGFRERIAPGAFTHSLNTDDIRCLFNHDANYVLGRNRSGTLRLAEDERGLQFEVDVPDAQWARDLYKSVQRGDVTQCSFAFDTLRDEWRTVDGVEERTIQDVKLYDVSIVTYPAYPLTEVSARSADDVLRDRRTKQRQASEAHKKSLRARLALKEKEIISHE